VESAAYKTPDNQNVAPEPVFQTLVFSRLLAQEDNSFHDHLNWLVTAAPPELPQGWQFSFRTALLPRAPSIVS